MIKQSTKEYIEFAYILNWLLFVNYVRLRTYLNYILYFIMEYNLYNYI